MIRRIAIATVPAIAALGVSLAAPAGAAGARPSVPSPSVRSHLHSHKASGQSPYGTCRLVVPATARVVRPGTAVPVRVTGGCALHADSSTLAGWYVGTSDNPSDYIFFDFSNRATWELYSFTPLGTRTWRGDGALDADAASAPGEGSDPTSGGSSGDDAGYAQNAPRTTVKVGSWAGLSTSRKGNTVTLRTRVIRYSTGRDENIPWAGQVGVIQYRASGATKWTALKNVRSNAAGVASYSYTSSAARDYRVVYGEAQYVWGTTSPTSHR
ncbi:MULTISPECIES: hypothetical protein [unclassified Allobranchiibius]|uniref:hypothetical protein n=1 Tax=unclassified Allobranchiibius TaxID=2649857 RepID=UPI001AA118E9|nr:MULTISPECIES: hypothetical protein [unclassified Allobranchiibius]MBO1767710.1 hypothetical protein [Allobranchiibius sp. GilTou38]UIJ36019.1 hypothetical protein LVQ62_06490 [Allobranchiibius sp. GilTou73]